MIIPNEKAYVEEILNSHTKPPKMGLGRLVNLLVRYYYPEHTEDKVAQFSKFIMHELEKFDLDSQMYQQYKVAQCVTDCCRKYKSKEQKQPLLNITRVVVNKPELEKIAQLKSNQGKKLLFTLYVLARVNSSPTGWVNYNVQDIFELANLKLTKNERYRLIFELNTAGLIKLNHVVDRHGYYVELLDGEEGLEITDFENLGKQYLLYERPDFFMCERCKRLVKRQSEHDRSSKYCKKCSEITDRDKAKDRMQKIRSKAKSLETSASTCVN